MLNKYDFKILNFIANNRKIEIKNILKNFPDDKFGTHSRLNSLLSNNFISKISDFSGDTNIFSITSKGVQHLQDSNLEKREKIINFILGCLYSLTSPIIVSAITTLITLYLKGKFN